MLQTSNTRIAEPSQSSQALSPVELLLRAYAIVRRHFVLCAGAVAACLFLAIIYLLITPQQFTATAIMAIDSRKSTTATPGSNQQPDLPIDSLTVESQTEFLKSENIALAVIRDLKLLNDPEFNESSGLWAIIGWFRSWFSSAEPPTEAERVRAVVEEFGKRLTIKRVGVTFVFEIGFTMADKERAAQVANAVADGYVEDQLQAKYASSKRAGDWLQERLKELGEQTSEAERKVVDFRIRNSIIDTGGRLMNEQQLAELNSQLALASANASEASAKLSRIQEIMNSGIPDANLTEALKSEVIVKLRNQYSDLQKREAEMISRLGSTTHQAVLNVRRDMQETQRSINQELQRIAQGYRSDYEIGKSRVESIQKRLSELVSTSNITSQAQIQLKALDSTAQSYRTMYDTFLQRYMESVQQQSFPLTDARVITKATPPRKKSKPKTLITLLAAMVGGGAIGFGLAWTRELLDRTFRTTEEVRSILGVPCISTVPMLDSDTRMKPLVTGIAHLGEVAAHPVSRFAESMRNIKVAIDFFPGNRRPQVVGFISAMPGEGKSTICANFAALAARSGARVILIDGDLRSPTLSARLTPGARSGLVELLSGRAAEGSVLRLDRLHCDFIPAVRKETVASSNELISSGYMQALLEKLKTRYDYVIVDLPPLVPVADARAAADLFDCFVLVVEWGSTSAEVVQNGFHASSRIPIKTVGAVLNKVHPTSGAYYENLGYAEGKYY